GDCWTSNADHDVGCLDDGPSLISGLEIEISNGFVRDCGRDDDPIADVDSDMGRRSTLLDFDDPALELVARAQLLHGVLLPRIGPSHTLPPRLRPPSATPLPGQRSVWRYRSRRGSSAPPARYPFRSRKPASSGRDHSPRCERSPATRAAAVARQRRAAVALGMHGILPLRRYH